MGLARFVEPQCDLKASFYSLLFWVLEQDRRGGEDALMENASIRPKRYECNLAVQTVKAGAIAWLNTMDG